MMMSLSLAFRNGCDDWIGCCLHSRCCRRSYVTGIVNLVGEDVVRVALRDLRRRSV
jgi:hypothetical protein